VSLLVVGEALVDVITLADGTTVERAGGSPANVAVGLGRLGHDVTLLTALGDDDHGRLLREHLEGSRVQLLTAPLPRTSTAQAVLDRTGDATYRFDIAWETGDLAPEAAPRWLHVGSIGAVLAPGAAQVRTLVNRYGGESVVSFDPNCRPLLMDDSDGELIEELVSRVHVVKLSEEDAAWLHPDLSPLEVARRWLALGPALVVVTQGRDGSFAVLAGSDDVVHAAPSDGAPVVDTVGAGDAFMSGLIDALSQHDLADLDVALVTGALRRASDVARRTCERVGADPPWEELP